MAKDYLGNEIQVGDRVIFTRLNYREFTEGTILKITPQKVLIDEDVEYDPEYPDYNVKTYQFHHQVIIKSRSLR